MNSKGLKSSIRKRHKWRDEEIQYLREIANGKLLDEIVCAFNCKFGCKFTPGQVRGALDRNGIKMGTKLSWIKDVGSESIGRHEYVEIKVSKNEWVLKHRYIYEQHFGKIQGNNQIIFLDGDKTNFNIDNLKEVTREQMAVINKYKLKCNDADLTKVGIQVANLIMKTNEIKREMKK